MARLAGVLMGPASSTGSPITFMMRPSVSSPTGTAMGRPVSVTSWPRTRPSEESMATVRTVFSPRCWATSSTRRWPWLVVSSAFRISGRCPSNCTSTTAPITWRILPTLLDAMACPYVLVLRLGVMPGLVPGIHRSACSGARGWLDPGHKARDDRCLQRLGAGDDLDQLLGDVGLALAVVLDGQLVDHVAGVAGGVVHGRHARALL